MRRYNYKNEIDSYIEIIKRMNCWDIDSEEQLHTYVMAVVWDDRKSGRGIAGNEIKFKVNTDNEKVTIDFISPSSDWKEWIRTAYVSAIPIDIIEKTNGFTFILSKHDAIYHPTEVKFINMALKKAAYCVGCQVCETNCKGGHIHFQNGKVRIDGCTQYHQCYDIPGECYVFDSLKIPQGEKKVKAINCFDDYAPTKQWLQSFFDKQNDFFTNHGLGPNQFNKFKRFLRDADLIKSKGNECTSFSELICNIGWDRDVALGLMLVNLAYENPQFQWYINNMDTDVVYNVDILKGKLMAEDITERASRNIIKAFRRIVLETPFGDILNFGYAIGDQLIRCKCIISDNRVLLYALYKFVEKCNICLELTMSFLYEDEGDRDGISPVRIFGLYDREELKSMLLGLSAAYPDFINAAFTNDMQSIMLRGKSSADVLPLFKEDE